MHRGSDDWEEEEDEDDDIRDEANRGFLAHAHGSLLTSSLSGRGGLESASSSSVAGGKVIVHLDMDAFYCQVESGIDPSLKGKPMAVVQYAPSGNLTTQTVYQNRRVDRSNQSLIAVSYEARARGVKRIMLGDQARAVCPEIILVQVCVAHKKADLAIYREAGAKVIEILGRYGPTERASIDEAYVDLTAAVQARMKNFGPEMIDGARKQCKLAGLEGQEQQALSREDVRNGVLVGGGGDRREEKDIEGQEIKSFLPTAATGSDDYVGAGIGDCDTKPASATATTNTSTITTMEHDTQQPSSTIISSINETGTITDVTNNTDEQQQQQQQQQLPESSSASSSPTPPSTNRAAAAWWARPLHVWTRSEKEMVCGATILSEMRAAVTAELGYTCSGGLAPSKLLAKLGSAMHKPNQQTFIVQEIVPILLAPMPVARLKGLGGDFGKKVMEDLGCRTIGEVVQTPLARLQALYGDSDADWLFKLVRGVDGDTVEDRRLAKSVSCGKTFYGHNNLRSMEQVRTWLRQLAGELTERLRKDADLHARIPQLLTVSFQAMGLGGQQQNVSRSAPLRLSIEQLLLIEVGAEAAGSNAVGAPTGGAVQESLAEQGLSLVRRWHKQQVDETPHLSAAHHALCLATLYLTAGNFLEIKQKSRMTSFFTKANPALPAASMSGADAGAGAAVAALTAPPSLFNLQRLPSSAASQFSSSSSFSSKSFSTQRTLPASQQQRFNYTQDNDATTHKGNGVGNSEGGRGGGGGGGGEGEGGGGGVAAALVTSGLDPAHIDPAVLAELPAEIRNEIMAGIAAAAATGRKVRSSTASAAPSSTKRKIESYFQKKSIAATAQAPLPASSFCSASPAKNRALDRYLKKKKV